MSIKVTRTPKSIIHWHSVKDELPDASIDVLAGLDNGEVIIANWDDEDSVWRSHGLVSVYGVTHWAELPEVPK